MSDCCAPKNGAKSYDLAVIGAGSAGFAAAITAAEQGAQVATMSDLMVNTTVERMLTRMGFQASERTYAKEL